MIEWHQMPWRTGRKVGRTIYAQHGSTPSDADRLIGIMDTPLLALIAVNAHNDLIEEVHRLRRVEEAARAVCDRTGNIAALRLALEAQ